MSHSCFYEGTVRHRRWSPVSHEFRYHVFLSFLDLAELPELFDGRWLWSARRANVAWFRRVDHFGDAAVGLDEAVRKLVETRVGWRPSGPIRLLTNLRYFGIQMNPLSLFFCYDESGELVDAVVAEVTNTPWNERHCYVLDFRDRRPRRTMGASHPKELHVSPFFEMEFEYHWRLTPPGERLFVGIEMRDSARRPFAASMTLRRIPFDGWQAARLLARHPCITAGVVFGIYSQAWRLWRKGVPFVPHPRHSPPQRAVQENAGEVFITRIGRQPT